MSALDILQGLRIDLAQTIVNIGDDIAANQAYVGTLQDRLSEYDAAIVELGGTPGDVGNTPPTAAFDAQPITGKEVFFDGSLSSDPDGTIASYSWDFGDENTSTEMSPTHTYPAAGTYTVTLTVTDDQGATGSTSQDVTTMAAP